MRNALQRLELTVHLKMQRRVKIAPVVVLHALVRSNKISLSKCILKNKYKKRILFFLWPKAGNSPGR